MHVPLNANELCSLRSFLSWGEEPFSEGAFTFGSIAWSEKEFVCSPLLSNDGRGRMWQNAKDSSLHFYIFTFLNRLFCLQSFSA